MPSIRSTPTCRRLRRRRIRTMEKDPWSGVYQPGDWRWTTERCGAMVDEAGQECPACAVGLQTDDDQLIPEIDPTG